MAKRKNAGNRSTNPATAANASNASTATATPDPMEQRIVAFAEQLGRIVGTVQARTEGWMDRDALSTQISGVRDSAAELLDQLKSTVSKGSSAVTGAARKPEASGSMSKGAGATGASATRGATATKRATGTKRNAGIETASAVRGRSGGVVDAPGKKHRKPMPADTRGMAADTRRNITRGRQGFVQPSKRNGRG